MKVDEKRSLGVFKLRAPNNPVEPLSLKVNCKSMNSEKEKVKKVDVE